MWNCTMNVRSAGSRWWGTYSPVFQQIHFKEKDGIDEGLTKKRHKSHIKFKMEKINIISKDAYWSYKAKNEVFIMKFGIIVTHGKMDNL